MSTDGASNISGGLDDGGSSVEGTSETLDETFPEVLDILEREGTALILRFGDGDSGSGSSDRRGGSDGESNSNNGGRTHVDKLNVKGKVLDKRLELGEVRSKS